jgi:DNA-binding MarR family transcriptional regulator
MSLADNISRPLFSIMMTLHDRGTMRVSEIGKRLLIPKPQMTHLVDKLTSLKLVERQPDNKDRRITNVSLTEEGKVKLELTVRSCATTSRRSSKNWECRLPNRH